MVASLGNKVKIRGALIQIGNKKINRNNWDWKQIEKNDFFLSVKLTVIQKMGKIRGTN